MTIANVCSYVALCLNNTRKLMELFAQFYYCVQGWIQPWQKGVLYNSAQSVLLGRSGAYPPEKFLDFTPSEIISGAVLGRNSSTMDNPLLFAATASYLGYKAMQTDCTFVVWVTYEIIAWTRNVAIKLITVMERLWCMRLFLNSKLLLWPACHSLFTYMQLELSSSRHSAQYQLTVVTLDVIMRHAVS